MPKSKIIGFYHPHARLQFSNELVNPATGEVFNPPSMTKQEFKRECDINNIVKHFQATGMHSHLNARAQSGAFIDLPDDMDYQNSIETVRRSQAAFMDLPSKVRDRFNNDPASFLAFMADPEKLDESYELGVRIKPRQEAPPPAPAPTPTPEPPKA